MKPVLILCLSTKLMRRFILILSVLLPCFFPKILYGSSPTINDRTKEDYFHQMFPNVIHHYLGIVELLLHLKWTWIGVIAYNNDNGDFFVQHVLPLYSQKGVCVDFLEIMPRITFSSNIAESGMEWFATSRIATGSTVNTVMIQGEIETVSVLRIVFQFLQFYDVKIVSRVLIMTAQMDFASSRFQRDWDIHFFHGALSFAVHTNYPPGFQKFLNKRNPLSENKDGFIRLFWQDAFNCDLPNSIPKKRGVQICTGEEKLESLPVTLFETNMSGHSYSIYNAVYIMAHALCATSSSTSQERTKMKNMRQKNLGRYLPKQG